MDTNSNLSRYLDHHYTYGITFHHTELDARTERYNRLDFTQHAVIEMSSDSGAPRLYAVAPTGIVARTLRAA